MTYESAHGNVIWQSETSQLLCNRQPESDAFEVLDLRKAENCRNGRIASARAQIEVKSSNF